MPLVICKSLGLNSETQGTHSSIGGLFYNCPGNPVTSRACYAALSLTEEDSCRALGKQTKALGRGHCSEPGAQAGDWQQEAVVTVLSTVHCAATQTTALPLQPETAPALCTQPYTPQSTPPCPQAKQHDQVHQTATWNTL